MGRPAGPPPLPYDGIVRTQANPGGRPRGAQAKVTRTLKEAILLAAEEVGDVIAEKAAEGSEQRPGGLMGYLVMVASSDPKSFCALLGRVLPMQVSGTDGNAITVEIVKRTYSD